MANRGDSDPRSDPPPCALTNGRPGFPFGCLGAGGRLPKARRGRVLILQCHYYRAVAIRHWGGAVLATPCTLRSCDGPRVSLSMRPLGLAGKRALQARLARLCRSHRSPSDRRTTGVSPHHTMTCNDVGGRVTDGAGSSVAAKWTDRERTVTLQPLPGWIDHQLTPPGLGIRGGLMSFGEPRLGAENHTAARSTRRLAS